MDSKITYIEFENMLKACFENHSVPCSLNPVQLEMLYKLTIILLQENEKFNLTAIRAPEGVVEKHIFDSISVSEYISKEATVIDVGTGAGFPALPLAIVRPDIKVTAIDSTEKKIGFVNSVCNITKVSNVATVCCRAEELSNDTRFRENYNIAIARSVASLPVLCELCLPFVRTGGKFIAMKSGMAEHEIEESLNARRILGGSSEIEKIHLYNDESGDGRYIYCIGKIKQTPQMYPRKFSQIKKNAL